MTLDELATHLDTLTREAEAAIAAAAEPNTLEAARVKSLGRPEHSRAPALPSSTQLCWVPGLSRKSAPEVS